MKPKPKPTMLAVVFLNTFMMIVGNTRSHPQTAKEMIDGYDWSGCGLTNIEFEFDVWMNTRYDEDLEHARLFFASTPPAAWTVSMTSLKAL